MRPLLGTFVEITADGAPARLATAIAAAFAAVERVQRLMSFHDPASDVARINAAPIGECITVAAETFAVLRAARDIGDASDGAFDIAVAGALVRNGFLPQPPDAPRSSAGDAVGNPVDEDDIASYRDLELLPGARTRWRRKGRIDLGGIAKGYAVDRAIEMLRSQGIGQGIVNAGGDLRCFGEPQPLYLREPDAPGSLLLVGRLRDEAAATSAGYFRSRLTRADPCLASGVAVASRTEPLVDPARRTCVSWQGSVTVVADDCMTADALTKVVRLAPSLAPRVLECYAAQAVLLDSRGARTCGRSRLGAFLPGTCIVESTLSVGASRAVIEAAP